MPELVGHIAAITRFPVKSMAGEPRDAAEIGWTGLAGDRQWAFVKADDATRFPWFTGRDLSAMVRHVALYDDPADPRRSGVGVTTPDGRRCSLDEVRAELEAASGCALRLMQLGRGMHDAMPVSIASTASFAALDAAHGAALDPRRFRTNVIVESATREGDWPGRRVRFRDGAALLLAYPAPRCAMVTIDPDSAGRDAGVMRTVAQRFDGAFATYASVARPGAVRVGDAVWVD